MASVHESEQGSEPQKDSDTYTTDNHAHTDSRSPSLSPSAAIQTRLMRAGSFEYEDERRSLDSLNSGSDSGSGGYEHQLHPTAEQYTPDQFADDGE